MITDHGMLSDSLRAMAQQNNITPTPNPVSQQMQTQTQATVQTLQGLSGAALDSAYVQAMVQSHQTTLNTIDTQLLPAAQNPQLRTALEQKVRPAVAMHLEQAQQIQNSLRQR
jgi:putative membrane protein